MEGTVDFNRKYRPTNLKDYLGNETRLALGKRFRRDKDADDEGKHYLPNVCLFTGRSGTGKTTAARIVAKQYLCMSPTEDGYACGECALCKEIDEYLIKGTVGDIVVGVTELDIATDSGKQKVMTTLEGLMLEPMYPAKFNIVILDEVHMATNQLQNSLLKLLEEPPKHLVFMLCTTNPEKLLDTVLSRVQYRLEIRKATVEDLIDRLEYICIEEGIDYSKDALRYIVIENNRVPRACLHMLSALAQSSSKITLDVVAKYGGGVSTDLIVMYYKAIRKDLADILSYINYLKENDTNFNDFYNTLVKVTLDAINIKLGINLSNYVDDYVKDINFILKGYTLDDILKLLHYLNYYANRNFNSTLGELALLNISLLIGKHLVTDTHNDLLSVYGLLGNTSNDVKVENSLAVGRYAEYLKESMAENTKVLEGDINSLNNVLGLSKANIDSNSLEICQKGIDIDNDLKNMLKE